LLNPWLALTFKAMQLGFDAQNVIALRMMRFAKGDAGALNEARRMVVEKITASAEAQTTAASGIISGKKDTVVANKVIRVLRKRVRANKRRLSRR
jgi:hypothetical protein